MKGKLFVFSLCAFLALALITVRLRSRALLLKYEIAELETYEELLLHRITFFRSEVEKRSGVVDLLTKALELGIYLHMGSQNGKEIPLLTSLEEEIPLE